MGIEGFGFQFRVELDADEPGMFGNLDNLRQAAVRRHAGEQDAGFFQLFAVGDVDLVAVAVALGNLLGPAINIGNL